MDSTFLDARIEAAKATIVAMESAILALSTDNTASFTLDTGQTRKSVVYTDIDNLKLSIDATYSRLFALEALKYGGTVTAVPGW